MNRVDAAAIRVDAAAVNEVLRRSGLPLVGAACPTPPLNGNWQPRLFDSMVYGLAGDKVSRLVEQLVGQIASASTQSAYIDHLTQTLQPSLLNMVQHFSQQRRFPLGQLAGSLLLMMVDQLSANSGQFAMRDQAVLPEKMADWLIALTAPHPEVDQQIRAHAGWLEEWVRHEISRRPLLLKR